MNATVSTEYTGVLLHNAEARTAMLDAEGHAVPVLCMDLELHNALHTRLHAEQYFPAGQHDQCHAAARRYKAGLHIRLQASLLDVRLVAHGVSHIHVLPTPAPATSPTPARADASEPDLFAA